MHRIFFICLKIYYFWEFYKDLPCFAFLGPHKSLSKIFLSKNQFFYFYWLFYINICGTYVHKSLWSIQWIRMQKIHTHIWVQNEGRNFEMSDKIFYTSWKIFYRLCSVELSSPIDCSGTPLLSHSLNQQNSSASQSLFHHQYRQHNSQTASISGLNLSSSATAPSAIPTPTISVSSSSSLPTSTSATPTLSNNLYNNNHLYHLNSTTSLSGGINNSKHNNSSSNSGNHHPTPIEGLTALSSLGSSSLHLTANSLCGGSSNTALAPELGMSHWLSNDAVTSGSG